MKIVVTGAAGFIGSSLAEKLLEDRHEVYGIDCITDNYSESMKRRNVSRLLKYPSFHFLMQNLTALKTDIFADIEIVFHLAGQPGVRNSWGQQFCGYVKNNIEATQILLERLKHSKNLKKFVFASTSSVYGNAQELPLKETFEPHPVSPYGVSKLTSENLCQAYSAAFNMPIVCLRYFTVYGPLQRPDMAFHRFFRASMRGDSLPLFGDGNQTRDYTFIEDIVRATCAAGFTDTGKRFSIFNVGSGRRVSMNNVLELLCEITGKRLKIDYLPEQRGDVKDTFADISRAMNTFSYAPSTSLPDGLKAQYTWMRSQEEPAAAV